MKGKYRGIKYFHLILTKIICITLKIHAKADLKKENRKIFDLNIFLLMNYILYFFHNTI